MKINIEKNQEIREIIQILSLNLKDEAENQEEEFGNQAWACSRHECMHVCISQNVEDSETTVVI